MYKINNWSSLQSYKDRKPPWIRLHKTLLDNFEFHSLSKNARALLPMLWLLASEHDDPTSGIIKYSTDQISFRLRMPKKELMLGVEECIDAEFIEQYQPCNEPVTKPLQKRSSTVTPETETETETKTEEEVIQLTQIIDLLKPEFPILTPAQIGAVKAWVAKGKTLTDIQDALIKTAGSQRSATRWGWIVDEMNKVDKPDKPKKEMLRK